MDGSDLLGLWELVSVTTPVDGGMEYPFGREPVGTIQYLQDGYMAVHLTGSDEAEGKTRAYSGTWSFEDDTVTHNIQVSLETHLRGETVRRRASLEGDRLIYRTEEAQGAGRPRVVWRRVP